MMRSLWTLLCALVLFAVFAVVGAVGWFRFKPAPDTCQACHEMQAAVATHAASVHKEVACTACHGRPFDSWRTTEESLRRFWRHVTATTYPRLDFPGEAIHAGAQIWAMQDACGACHAARHKQWMRGPQCHPGALRCTLCHPGHGTEPVALYQPAEHVFRPVSRDGLCRTCHEQDGDRLKGMRDWRPPQEEKDK